MSGQSEEKIYKIGQAAKLVGLKSYVLRFWEGEFEQLEPIRTPSGQRLYNEQHIALISRIKGLLHDEGLTIEGARKRLESPEVDSMVFDSAIDKESSASISQLSLFGQDSTRAQEDRALIEDIHAELLEIKNLLE